LLLYATSTEIPSQSLALPPRLEASSEALAERLLSLAIRTLPVRAGLGVRRTIESLAALAQTSPERREALSEVSVGYVATGAKIGLHSARAGLRMVLDVIGHAVLCPDRAREAGYPVRDVKVLRYRGPLRVLTPETLAALRRASSWLRENDLGVGDPVGAWRALPEEDLAERGFERLEGGARRGWALCPLHGETKPSLRLFDLAGSRGSHGAGYCHGCQRRIAWTRSDTGEVFVREARGESVEEPSHREEGSSFPFTLRRDRAIRFVEGRPRSIVPLSPGSVIDGATFERLAGRAEGYVAGDRGAEGMRRRWSLDVLRALCWSDRSGPVAEREALLASARAASLDVDSRVFLPDRYLSVSPLRATSFSLRPLRALRTGSLAAPTRFEAASQEWILVDLDDLDAALGWTAEDFVERVARRASADPRLSGRLAVVRTSHGGLQVWSQLARPEPSSRLLWRQEGARRWYASVAEGYLADARASGRSGGFVDYSAAAPGRYGRRPGWRLLDGFEPFRVRVEAVVLDPGESPVSASEARRRLRKS
jgi:hypothetical protein